MVARAIAKLDGASDAQIAAALAAFLALPLAVRGFRNDLTLISGAPTVARTGAELRLGEVEHAAQPEGEHQTGRKQAVGEAIDRAQAKHFGW